MIRPYFNLSIKPFDTEVEDQFYTVFGNYIFMIFYYG